MPLFCLYMCVRAVVVRFNVCGMFLVLVVVVCCVFDCFFLWFVLLCCGLLVLVCCGVAACVVLSGVSVFLFVLLVFSCA